MKHLLKSMAIVIGLLLQLAAARAGGAQTGVGQIPLTNNDIFEMKKAGLSDDVVIAKIQCSQSTFDTSPTALSSLNAAGIGDNIILAMVTKASSGATTIEPGPTVAKPQEENQRAFRLTRSGPTEGRVVSWEDGRAGAIELHLEGVQMFHYPAAEALAPSDYSGNYVT